MKKQHILDEIKRTAVANGGAPLGRERFERETGIKESDWAGRYWVRWGEAVKEAGFEPNSLVAAHQDEFLLESYVRLVRELGHIPVNGELRLKRRADPEFPSEKVFRRFGAKAELLARVKEYCLTRGGCDDVVVLLGDTAPPAEDSPEQDSGEDEFGFVYLIRSGRHFKIGRTNAVGRREREIALQLPEKAKTVHIIRTDDPPGIEAYWHNRFAAKRRNGEWFELEAVDVKAFKRRKFM